ncbi:MAG: peptidase M3, partial [Tannerella sp.]|nr:peptidase M3 [Tannerella sp.]
MKKMVFFMGLIFLTGACNVSSDKKSGAATDANPFLSEYTTPFGVPPFDRITLADYKPAILQGMEEQKKEVDAIVNATAAPDFENTIAALDQS